jgi:hypothetical protein
MPITEAREAQHLLTIEMSFCHRRCDEAMAVGRYTTKGIEFWPVIESLVELVSPRGGRYWGVREKEERAVNCGWKVKLVVLVCPSFFLVSGRSSALAFTSNFNDTRAFLFSSS